jgi:putative ABC transport system permease protein
VQQAPLGFDSSNVFTLQFRLPQSSYPTPDDIARFFKRTIENVRAVPGVQSAALVRAVPFSGNGGTIAYTVEGQPQPDPTSAPQALFHLVTPDYFKTMRIPILKGRDFTDRDDTQTPLVAVINDTFARRAFPGEDPIGKRFTTPQTQGPITVIGVVGDAKHYTATEPARAQLYAAHYQVPLIFSSLVARTTVEPMSVTDGIRRAIWAVDKDQPVWSSTRSRRRWSGRRAVALPRAAARHLRGMALLLAGVGLRGDVVRRLAAHHEIGIRLALGASGERVLRDIVGRGVRLTSSRWRSADRRGRDGPLAAAVLFGVTPTDRRAGGAAASWPSCRSRQPIYPPGAPRVDPVVALAEE